VRVGACSYSANIRSGFNLSAYTTAVDVKSAVSLLLYAGGHANTAAALTYVRTKMLTSAAGDRRNVSNIIVLFTDGPASNPFAARVSQYSTCTLFAPLGKSGGVFHKYSLGGDTTTASGL